MTIRTASAFLGATIVLFSSAAVAADHLVAVGGTGSGACNPTPCSTVAAALAGAVSGDEIKIAEGLYVDPTTIALSSGTLELTISGGWSPDFTAQSIFAISTLRGNTTTPALSFRADSDASLTVNLYNLDFYKNKVTSFSSGSAISALIPSGAATELTLNIDLSYFESNNGVLNGGAIVGTAITGELAINITSTVFVKNKTSGVGGAIAMFSNGGSADLSVEHTDFYLNKAKISGGAVAVSAQRASLPTLDTEIQFHDCLFSSNKAGSSGGGAISTMGTGHVEIQQNFEDVVFASNKSGGDGGAVTVVSNSESSGGIFTDIDGAYLFRNSAKGVGGGLATTTTGTSGVADLGIANSTVTANKAKGNGGGVSIGGTAGTATAALANSIFWANRAADGIDITIDGVAFGVPELSHNDMAAITGGGSFTNLGGNVSIDPLFVDAKFDPHLQSTSSLRDLADCSLVAPSDVDFDGDDRPTGPGCDIGADELEP